MVATEQSWKHSLRVVRLEVALGKVALVMGTTVSVATAEAMEEAGMDRVE